MNEIQKKTVKILLQNAWDNGFGDYMSLEKLAEKVGVVPQVLYDCIGCGGELWEYGSEWGNALIDISEHGHGIHMVINFDMKELAEAWSQ